MSPDRQRLLNDLTAVEASLRSEVRRHYHNPYSSFFRFENEYLLKGRPTRVRDGFGEMVVFEHVLDSQILDGDKGVSINVLPGCLVSVIPALAGDLEMLLRRIACRLLAAFGAFYPASRLPLRPPELFTSLSKEARVLDHPALGVGKKDLEANLKANRRTVPLFRRFPEVAHNEGVPMAVGAKYEMSRLRSTFEWTMLLDLDVASELLGNSQSSGFMVKTHIPAQTVLPKLDGVPAVSSLETRKANLPSKAPPAKEPPERLIQPIGKSLYSRLRDVFTAPPFEQISEVVAAMEPARLFIMSLRHLKHIVVKAATFHQARKESATLNAVRKEPVFKGFVHCHSDTLIRDSVQRQFIRQLRQAALLPLFFGGW